MFKIVQNKAPNLCLAYRCPNDRTPKDRFCSKHSKRYQKTVNLYRYGYQVLKGSARRRGKEFKLTVVEYTKFCKKYNYLERKGRHKTGYAIDRIDPAKGYQLDNMQVLTNCQNAKKMHVDKKVCPFQ